MENYSKPKTEILNIKPRLRADFGVSPSQRFTHVREVRLAMTIDDPDSDPTYPEPDDEPNTYGLAFLDGEFNETAGQQEPTMSNNSLNNKPQVWGHHVHNKYLPVGTVVIAKLVPGLDETESGEWWIDTDGATIMLGKTDVEIGNESSGLVSWYDGTQGDEEDTDINFTCWNKFATVAADAWVLFYQSDDGYYLLPIGGAGSSNPAVKLGKAYEDIDTDASGLVNEYAGAPGAEVVTGAQFTCKNKFEKVYQGDWVLFVRIGTAYYLWRGGGSSFGRPGYRFRLTEALVLGGEADAQKLNWNGAAYVTAGEIVVHDWFTNDPGMFRGAIGYEGMAVFRDIVNDGQGNLVEHYDIIWMEGKARWIYGYLNEGIHVSGDFWIATGTVDQVWHLQGRSAEDISEIYDVNGHFKLALEGALFKAEYNDREDRYEFTNCEQMAVKATATLKHKMCDPVSSQGDEQQPNSPLWEIEEFAVYGEGEHVLPPAIVPEAASNHFGHKGKAADKILLQYGLPGHETEWTIVGVDLHEVEVVTSVGQEGCSLSRATATIAVELCDDPGEAEPYGELGVPFQFTQYKTRCTDGVMITEYRTVDVDPCAETQVTYGSWATA